MPNDMRSINLKILRVRKNLTQAELAEKVGVSNPTYNLIEQGKRKGSIEFWVKLQQVFNLSDAEMWQLYSNKEYAINQPLNVEKR